VTAATWVAAGVCALFCALLLGWGLRWLLIDAHERKLEKEAADRYLAHQRALRSDNRRLRSIEGDPE
jgi:hypothetical protein